MIPIKIAIPEIKPPKIDRSPKPEPVNPLAPQSGKPVVPRPGRSSPRQVALGPEPVIPEPVIPEPLADQPPAPVTMPVEYFLQYPGGLATEPASQEVNREVAFESMRQAELNPAPATPAQQPVPSQESREQLLSEGCWVLQNGTGTIQCPSSHPSNQPTPVYQETEDGFIVGMHDPSTIGGNSPERRYQFRRQEDGSYIYRDHDRRNWILIHPDGRMEVGQNLFKDTEDLGLIYRVLDLFSGDLPWDRPEIPHYQWREMEDSTRDVRRQMAEQFDASVTREALDGLSLELKRIIDKHSDWSLAQQHDFLFRRWDECREDSVGNEARTTIEEYIRRNYPQGTPREITAEELRDFNDRRQTESQSFCPYGCVPGMTLDLPQPGDSL
jgi:hypothetical protein